MTDKKSMFRRMFESIAEGRSRQAQRYVDQYLSGRGFEAPGGDAAEKSSRRTS